MPGIGLMMIVKDEAHVVARCLESARDLVDWWVVADTGSTDGTQDVVRAAMEGVPGELVERPWVDFGHNRQEVLDLARRSPHARPGDYVAWIDADEHFVDVPDRETLARVVDGLDLDGYHLTVRYDDNRYARLVLVRLDADWRWRGPIHEYLDLPGATLGTLDAPGVVVEHTGARSRDPETYRKDVALIEKALAGELEPRDRARLQFYLAQSLRDAGELERSAEAYRVRVENPDGWDQEQWFARFQLARLLEWTGRPLAEVREALLDAYQACPWRAEPLVELARIERAQERYAVALLYARAAAALPMPGSDALFVDVATYTWRAWDEVAVSCYWTGAYAEGVAAAERALAVRPDDERLQANLDWCRKGLAAAG